MAHIDLRRIYMGTIYKKKKSHFIPWLQEGIQKGQSCSELVTVVSWGACPLRKGSCHCWDTGRFKEMSLLVKDHGRKVASLVSGSGDLGHQSCKEGASAFLGHSSKELRLLARATTTCRILSGVCEAKLNVSTCFIFPSSQVNSLGAEGIQVL